MPQVEKLSIEIEASNNVRAGLKSVEDDLAGFTKRTKSDRSVELSLRIGALQTAKAEAEQQLKAFKASGDRLGQISVRADIAILKQNLNQANRELTNFARTGNEKVSVLGKLFGGVGNSIRNVGTSVSGVASNVTAGFARMAVAALSVEKVISLLKNSFRVFSEEAEKVGGNTKGLDELESGWRRIQYVIGSGVNDVFQRFFALFGEGVADGTNKVRNFSNSVIGGMQKAGAAARNFAVFLGDAIGESAAFVVEAFKSLPQAAEASFGYILTKLDGFVQDWAQGVKTLTFGKIDITGDVGVPNPFKGVNFPDFRRKFALTTKMIAMDWETATGNMAVEWEGLNQDMVKRSEESGRVISKKAQENGKKQADDAKKLAEEKAKQEKDDAESVERVRQMKFDKEMARQEKLRDAYKTAYSVIGDELDKAKDKVQDLDEKLADLAKKRAETSKDAATSLGERYVEVEKELQDIIAGRETGDNLGALMKEKSAILKATTEKQRADATAYAGLTKAEQIIFDRDVALDAIDAETKALQAKRDEELAAVQAVADKKAELERMFTATMGEEITKQISLQDQLIAKLREVEQAARSAAAAKASAGAGAAPVTNNVTVNNAINNPVDAKIVTNAITSKLSS